MTLFQRRLTDGQRYLKRYSTSRTIREMQTKTTMRYHHTRVRIVILKKKKRVNKSWQRCRKKGTLVHYW